MTDKPTPTDAELKAMWQLHAADIGGIFHYARAVLAKWGQPAQAAEPFCWHWENTFNGGMGAVKKNPETLGINMAHPDYKWTALYTAPQPTQTQAVALLDYAMQIAHERELRVTGFPHDEDGAKRVFEAAVMRHTATGAAEAASVQEDAARLDFLIEQRAYVVSDPDACPGHWLRWARPDGSAWVQVNEHPTPRAAIDAARKQ